MGTAAINLVQDAPHTLNAETASDGPQVHRAKKIATYALEQACGTASSLVSVALSATGLSRRAAGEWCGVNRNLVDHWATPEHPRTMPLGRLLALASTSRRGREAAIAILTGALVHVQAIALEAAQDRDLRGLVDDLHAEVGDLACEWRAATRDGVITAEEREALVREVGSIERVLAALRHELGKETE